MSRERRRRRQASNALGVVVLVVSLLIVGGIFLASRLGGSRLGPDLCEQSGPSGLLALAVDATDRLSEAQIPDVKTRLQREVADVPSNWRVEVWNIAPASGVPVTVGPPLCKLQLEDRDLDAVQALDVWPSFQRVTRQQRIRPVQFLADTRDIFEWSKKRNCRFFVWIDDSTGVAEKRLYKERLRAVGQHFYYFEPSESVEGRRVAQ